MLALGCTLFGPGCFRKNNSADINPPLGPQRQSSEAKEGSFITLAESPDPVAQEAASVVLPIKAQLAEAEPHLSQVPDLHVARVDSGG
jgi:hypothetical protein